MRKNVVFAEKEEEENIWRGKMYFLWGEERRRRKRRKIFGGGKYLEEENIIFFGEEGKYWQRKISP